MVNLRVIELHFVPTEFNVADILTKPLDIDTFIRLRDIMMNGHGGLSPCFEHVLFALNNLTLSTFHGHLRGGVSVEQT